MSIYLFRCQTQIKQAIWEMDMKNQTDMSKAKVQVLLPHIRAVA